MFEKITLRNSETGGGITPGHIAEALLYHQNVHLLMGRGNIFGLSRDMGPDVLVELIERSDVSCTFVEEMLGTHTDKSTPLHVYDWGCLNTIGHQDTGRSTTFERVVDRFEEAGSNKSDAKKYAKRFLKASSRAKFSTNHYVEGGVASAARNEADDKQFFENALAEGLAHEINRPDLVRSFQFNAIRLENGYSIADKIDWHAVNAERQKLKPGVDPLTTAHLVSAFVESIADLHIASHYGGEYVTTDASSEIARLKYAKLMNRLGRDTDVISEFQETELDNVRAIRDCINSKDHTFTDFMKIIDRRDARKFKDFWAGVNPDSNALKAYYNENAKDGWIASLPSRATRLAVCTTIGYFNPSAGIILSAADMQLTEKLARGWRPHHFVDKQLKPFVRN